MNPKPDTTHHTLRAALLALATQADSRPGLVLTPEALDALNAAVAMLAHLGKTTPQERRSAVHRMRPAASRLRLLAALLTR